MKKIKILFTSAVLLLIGIACNACSSASGQASFAWLGENGGTYWYVPPQYLTAIQWPTSNPSGYTAVSDQTVWHIERYENGYIFGPVTAQFTGYPPTCQYLIGSITPSGQVYISFTSTQDIPIGNPSITTGLGIFEQQAGLYAFTMQMASGSSSTQISHWASMLQCSPGDPCWGNLPGVNESIPDFLANCN